MAPVGSSTPCLTAKGKAAPSLLSLSPGNILRFLGSEYYLLNLAILASYQLIFRGLHTQQQVDIHVPFTANRIFVGKLHSATFGNFESQVAGTLLLTVLARTYQGTSLDAMAACILGYSQLFVLILTFSVDWMASVLYLLAFGVVFLVCNEPCCKAGDKVKAFTAVTFIDKCMADTEDGVAHVVFLHTSWSSRCRHAFPLFVELANRYATDKLRFVTLDVGVWPKCAAEMDVDISCTSTQLPTVVCCESGKETGRVPQGGSKSLRGGNKWTFSKMDLINALELDVRYARTMHSPAQPSPGPSTS